MSPVDVAALAQSAIAGVMRVVSRCGRTIGDSQQLEDVAALTASIPVEFQTSIVLAHNTDALADSLPYVDALSIFFKDQQTTHCGHAVFVNCAKNLYVHREASGVWRCGRGIGSAETLCFTSGAGGSLPPCQGWVDSHGEPITDLVCLNPHLWSALSVRKLQLGDETRATTSATTSWADRAAAAGGTVASNFEGSRATSSWQHLRSCRRRRPTGAVATVGAASAADST
jgi:ribosomal protein L37AE/L43A